MNKAERIHRTKQIIKKRLNIIKNVWQTERARPAHSLHKFNLNCGCKMCHFYKYVGNSMTRLRHRDRKLYDKNLHD